LSETGANIVKGFQELRKFCRQVSVLLKTADGMMREQDWKPIPRSSVTGNSSGKVDEPDLWLPTEFSRFYLSTGCPRLLTYIAVIVEHVDDEWPIEEAILSAGCLAFEPGHSWKGEYWFSHLHLEMETLKTDGTPCREHPQETWTDEQPPVGLETVTTFARPLDEFVNSDSLRKKLVDPLMGIVADSSE
jgi:hypothetical protein